MAIRILRVGEGLWFEEVIWVRSATSSLRGTMLLSGLTHAHPPLYVFLLKAWIWVGGHADIWLRLSSLLCGVASVAIVYLWAARRFGAFVGLIGSLYLAVSTFHVHYSVELRPQALMVLLVVSLVWMVDRWLDTPDRKIFLAVALVLEVALVLTHTQGLFITGAVAIYGFAVRPCKPQHLVAWTVTHFVVIAAVSWWLPLMLLQRGHIPAAAFRAAESALPLDQWVSLLGPATAHTSRIWAVGGGVLALIAAAIGLFRAWRSWPGRETPSETPRRLPLVFTRPLFITMIVSMCLAVLLPLTQLWLTAVTDRHLEALVGELGWTYLIVAGLFAVLIGFALLRQRLQISLRLSLPLFVIGASVLGLWSLGLKAPDHSLRDLLHLLPFFAVFIGRGLEPRHWTSAVVASVLVAALAAPSLLASTEQFLPRQDFRGCARIIEGHTAATPGVANFVIPMWDRGALEYYLGEGTATGIMSVDDLPPSNYLPNVVNVVMTRGAADNSEVFARAFGERLLKTHEHDATVSLRRVHMIRYIRH